jgi:hypothetical protein
MVLEAIFKNIFLGALLTTPLPFFLRAFTGDGVIAPVSCHPLYFCFVSDLMLPGVIVNGPVTPQTFKHLEKGSPASVNLLPNK